MKVLSLKGLSLLVFLSFILLAGCASYENEPSEEMTTLTVELFDRFNTPAGAPPLTDNAITQYIQEQFGDPNGIRVQFVTVPRAEEVSRLHILMDANQAPDIIFTYDIPTVQHFVNQGQLTDLGPLIEEHGPDLKKVLGDVLKFGVFDGKQYAIPAKRVLTAQTTTIIREDWLNQLGLSLPETTEQFYEALKAFKDHNPGNSRLGVIPYGLVAPFHMAPLKYAFWDWDQISEEDLYAQPHWLMPGNKEAFRFLNKLYHEKLIDPDFALHMNRDTQYFQKDLVGGRIGAATPNTNEPVYMGYLAELQKNDPNAILTPIDPFTSSDGKRRKPVFQGHGMFIMVPKSSNNAEAAIKYLNWMAQPEHYMTLQNGFEGVTYQMEDGLPVTLDNEEARQMLYNYFDYCIIINGKLVDVDNEELNILANATDEKYREFTLKSIEFGMNDGVVEPHVPAIIHSEIKYSQLLNDKDEEIFVKVITAHPEQFDDIYDAEVAEYMRIGGQQVMEEKRAAYRAHAR